MQHLLEDILLVENAVFLPASNTLVISDLQLGQEQQLRKRGHNVRYQDAERMLRLLQKLIQKHSAKRVVINGDLKHEFGKISAQERRDVRTILEKLKETVEVVIVRGNHDTITKPLADELDVPFVDSWQEDGILCVHGHQEPEHLEDTIIIGHMHPAIVLSDGVRREKFKCFLVGKYKRKRLIVLPSFTTIVDGVDVLTTGSNTPLLSETALRKTDVYVIADEIRRFGTLRDLIKKLSE